MPGLTVPHLIDLGDDRDLVGARLGDGRSWDALRTRTAGPFALADDRAAWEAQADERPEIGDRMRLLADVLEKRGVRTLASYGVGGALPECWLRRLMPGLRLVLTDHGDETVARLAALLGPDATVLHHDLLREPPVPADLHLFHRIDTEFRDRQWRHILRHFAGETIVLVATDVYGARRMREELRAMPHRRGWTRAGWIRTRGAFERLWRRTHRGHPLELGDLDAWLLEPRRD